jgi:hypothetical protein
MRQHVNGAYYDAACLKVMRKAFDDAWMSIEPNLPEDPRKVVSDS